MFSLLIFCTLVSKMPSSVSQYVKRDKIPGNEGARSQELETDEIILEMRVPKMSRKICFFFIKLIRVIPLLSNSNIGSMGTKAYIYKYSTVILIYKI